VVSFSQGASCCSNSWHTCSKDTLSGCRPTDPRGLLTSSHGKLPRGTAEGCQQRPQVQQHTHPAGGHLDPEDGPASAEEGFNAGTFIAVGKRTASYGQSRKKMGEWSLSLLLSAFLLPALTSLFSFNNSMEIQFTPISNVQFDDFYYIHRLVQPSQPVLEHSHLSRPPASLSYYPCIPTVAHDLAFINLLPVCMDLPFVSQVI
jgi:hypothetical protein